MEMTSCSFISNCLTRNTECTFSFVVKELGSLKVSFSIFSLRKWNASLGLISAMLCGRNDPMER